MTKTRTLEVKEREDGELYLDFPKELLEAAGWQIGDSLNWKDQSDGSYILTKNPTDWVLVECVSTFRHRYMVQVPTGKTDWALDTVACSEAKEFSQEHLGEQIVTHRVVSRDEALSLCRSDNTYISTVDDDRLIDLFFTTLEDVEK